MLPHCRNSHDADYMGEGAEPTLSIRVEFSPELGKIGDVVWPREGDGEGGETPENEGGGDGEEENDKYNGCV